jgi:hypothetical protein
MTYPFYCICRAVLQGVEWRISRNHTECDTTKNPSDCEYGREIMEEY